MKIVVVGGSGLIGSKLGRVLRDAGHEVVSASPRTGVNTITGAGLANALRGAQVTVDVSNSPSFEANAVMEFFGVSTRNLLHAETAAGVGHHVVLSIVGADRVADNGYLQAKIAQENLVKESGIAYTILRATQFFEFVDTIATAGAEGDAIRLTTAQLQPVAAEDVAAELAAIAVTAARNATVEIAGPRSAPLSAFAQQWLRAIGDPRTVIGDPEARYFGAILEERALVPWHNPRLGRTTFETWLAQARAAK